MTDDPLDAVKWCGYETLTHEEILRRQQRAEALEPIYREDAKRMAAVFDSLIQEPNDVASRLQTQVEGITADMVRRRDVQLAPYIPGVLALREAGLDVWLEEGPAQFSAETSSDGAATYRATSTARIRYTGDGGPPLPR